MTCVEETVETKLSIKTALSCTKDHILKFDYVSASNTNCG